MFTPSFSVCDKVRPYSTRTLVIHPDHPEIMWAGGVSGGVWKTTDAGRFWRPVSDRLANIAVNSMAVDPENPDVLYIGTGEGYFREIVRGTWAVENTGFANVVTEWLTLGTDDDGKPWLFAFTHGRGAFKVRLNPLPAAPREPAGRRRP